MKSCRQEIGQVASFHSIMKITLLKRLLVCTSCLGHEVKGIAHLLQLPHIMDDV